MSSRLLLPASEISTHFRCDNCGILIHQVSWKQCKVCKAFDLCDECAHEYPQYGDLPLQIHRNHQKLHANTPVNNDCMKLISVIEAETGSIQAENKVRQKEYERIVNEKKIRNDYEMAVVMDKLKQTGFESKSSSKEDQLNSVIVGYHLKASQRNIRVISLDGGGVRGYMPIKILGEFITQKYLPDIENLNSNDLKNKVLFEEAQKEFTKQFDYFAGTSTGGLIAFCLAINYNIMDMKEIYSDAPHYFKKNHLGPVIYSKYDPSVIHKKIDDIIDWITFPGNKKISAENATLLDIRNLLNPDSFIDEEAAKLNMYKRGNFLEFADENNSAESPDPADEENYLYQVPREKVLLITAYNTTHNIISIFNTSYSKHWGYRIADVLKSTMAAPTYFPPHEVHKGRQENGCFIPGPTSELYIDGGVFANDPELAALWAIRMQWKKPVKYHILSIGTGIYKSSLSPSTWGGYCGWIFNNAILIDTLMGAPGSFTEIVGGNLAKFSNMRRMKLNYKLSKSMNLDDPEFVRVFDQEWEYLKNEDDFKAFGHFYNKYFIDGN